MQCVECFSVLCVRKNTTRKVLLACGKSPHIKIYLSRKLNEYSSFSKPLFLCENILKCNLFLMHTWIFSIITLVYADLQLKKDFVLITTVKTVLLYILYFFHDPFDGIESSKDQDLFFWMFCNIINVFSLFRMMFSSIECILDEWGVLQWI